MANTKYFVVELFESRIGKRNQQRITWHFRNSRLRNTPKTLAIQQVSKEDNTKNHNGFHTLTAGVKGVTALVNMCVINIFYR